MKLTPPFIAVMVLAASLPLRASGPNGFDLDVVADGRALRELHGRGAVYVEALKNRPDQLRITNPLPVRVAVALSVDGRNTIDAKRSSAWDASKWVLEPFETTVISGWQVSGETARLFTFTTEERSYAAWLGDTSNLGVIEAVFYREKVPAPVCSTPDVRRRLRDSAQNEAVGGAAPAPAAARKSAGSLRAEAADGLAATGMGDATSHVITRVAIDLDRAPVAQVRIRYEYHDQLVALGLLPRVGERPPARREHASGFETYCPQP